MINKYKKWDSSLDCSIGDALMKSSSDDDVNYIEHMILNKEWCDKILHLKDIKINIKLLEFTNDVTLIDGAWGANTDNTLHIEHMIIPNSVNRISECSLCDIRRITCLDGDNKEPLSMLRSLLAAHKGTLSFTFPSDRTILLSELSFTREDYWNDAGNKIVNSPLDYLSLNVPTPNNIMLTDRKDPGSGKWYLSNQHDRPHLKTVQIGDKIFNEFKQYLSSGVLIDEPYCKNNIHLQKVYNIDGTTEFIPSREPFRFLDYCTDDLYGHCEFNFDSFPTELEAMNVIVNGQLSSAKNLLSCCRSNIKDKRRDIKKLKAEIADTKIAISDRQGNVKKYKAKIAEIKARIKEINSKQL